MLDSISTYEIKSHALEFDALKGWCGNFYTRRTRVSCTRFSLTDLRNEEEEEQSRKKEKKKKEGKEEETHGKTKPTPWSHLQNQTHPWQNQIHPFVSISTCKTKPTYKEIFLLLLLLCVLKIRCVILFFFSKA